MVEPWNIFHSLNYCRDKILCLTETGHRGCRNASVGQTNPTVKKGRISLALMSLLV